MQVTGLDFEGFQQAWWEWLGGAPGAYPTAPWQTGRGHGAADHAGGNRASLPDEACLHRFPIPLPDGGGLAGGGRADRDPAAAADPLTRGHAIVRDN